MKKFSVKKIHVKKYRIVCIVACQQGYEKSNLSLKQKVLNEFPNLAYHKCKNKNHNSFSDEIDKTEIAHVFEHIVIDLQTRYMNNQKHHREETFFGTTQSYDKDQGLYNVELNYFDDIVALRSIKEAEEFINKALTI